MRTTELFREFFVPIVVTIVILIAASIAITIIWAIFGYVGNMMFHRRIKAGTPVKFDDGSEKTGWYVVKRRDGDRVELVLIIIDKPERDFSKMETDVICDIELLKPL